MNKLWIFGFVGLFLLLLFFYFVRQRVKEPSITSSTTSTNMLTIASLAFKNSEIIPKKYTCDGEDVNPPIMIENVSTNAKSLALIVDDPDAPVDTWNHWLVWNIDPATKEINEDSVPASATLGTNDFGKLEYGGPCPPSETHRYFFRVFALDTKLDLPQGAKRGQLETAIKNHIIDQGELMGKYSR